MRQKEVMGQSIRTSKSARPGTISTAHAGNSIRNPDNQGTGIFYESKCTWDQ
jgi:hypothetical protein